MITFCEGAFQARRDPYQWILTEYYDGKDRKGNPKVQRRETYHPTLGKVCSFVLDKCAGHCNDAEEIKELLTHADRLMDEKGYNLIEEAS